MKVPFRLKLDRVSKQYSSPYLTSFCSPYRLTGSLQAFAVLTSSADLLFVTFGREVQLGAFAHFLFTFPRFFPGIHLKLG